MIATRASIVVNRTNDSVVVMVPGIEDRRAHAVLTEEEAFCASSAIRRMVAARDERSLTLGTIASGIRVDRVGHTRLPVELRFEDEDGTTVVDLTRDDATGVADMLWGAHRAGGGFHVMTSIAGGVRTIDRRNVRVAITPVPDVPDAIRTLGEVARRVRGREPEAKD